MKPFLQGPLAAAPSPGLADPYPGMPPLQPVRRVTSYFEFWPTLAIYLPVVCWWLLLSLRYRSLTLPLLVNRRIPLGGMVGESKGQILSLAGPFARQFIAPFYLHRRDRRPLEAQLAELEGALAGAGIEYPFVAKPDQGCRGAGVQKIADRSAMLRYLEQFPLDMTIMCQRLCRWQPEAGVFYVREGPGPGRIVSLTLKYPAVVLGDGRRSLAQLIDDDPRAGKIAHIYQQRLADRLAEVPLPGQVVTLSFAGNHCRGALFRNGNGWVTEAMGLALDRVLQDVDGFCYGRLDVRFADIERFQHGEDFEVIEINGVSSEAAHIWDPDTPLREVFRVLFWQYRTLFRMGDQLRRAGHVPPSVWALWRAWRDDAALSRQYPPTH